LKNYFDRFSYSFCSDFWVTFSKHLATFSLAAMLLHAMHGVNIMAAEHSATGALYESFVESSVK